MNGLLQKERLPIKEMIDMPDVFLIGKSLVTKKSTVKAIDEIINQFGKLNNFNYSRKTGLKFLIETAPDNVIPIVRQMQGRQCLPKRRLPDKGMDLNGHLQKINLFINLQVRDIYPSQILKNMKWDDSEIQLYSNH